MLHSVAYIYMHSCINNESQAVVQTLRSLSEHALGLVRQVLVYNNIFLHAAEDFIIQFILCSLLGLYNQVSLICLLLTRTHS